MFVAALVSVWALPISAHAAGLADLPFMGCYHNNNPGCTNPFAQNGGGRGDVAAMTADGQHLYVAGQHVIYHFTRNTTTGALTLHDCLDEETAGNGDPADCKTHTPGSQLFWGVVSAIALSPDPQQKDVYLVTSGLNAVRTIAHLKRDPATGALSWGECIAAVAGTTCPTSFGTSTDSRSSMSDVKVSPDGMSVVATSINFGGSELLNLDRNAATGALTMRQCFTFNNPGDSACTNVPSSPTSCSTNSINLDGIAVSGDNADVYVAADLGCNQGAVLHFPRGNDGALSYRNCIGIAQSQCDQSPGGLIHSGDAFGASNSIAVTPDGEVYVGGGYGSTSVIVHLRRGMSAGPTHGDLSFGNCLSYGTSPTSGCGAWLSGAPGANSAVILAGFSSDGQSIYATTPGYNTHDAINTNVQGGVLHFSRDTSATATHGDVTALTSCFATPDIYYTYAPCVHPPASVTASQGDPTIGAYGAALSPDDDQLYVPTGGGLYGGQGLPLLQLGVPPPSATTGVADQLTQTLARLNGTSNPNGLSTTYHFDYGTSTAYGAKAPIPDGAVGSDSSVHPEAQTISGLMPGTTYHFRIVATSTAGAGATYGADQTFTTQPQPPSASTGLADQLTQTSARLNGTSNPNGLATTYHFDYGSSTAYGTSAPVPDGPVGSDNIPHTLGLTISGLAPGTIYHFRIVATSGVGTTYGPDQTFTTLALPAVSINAPATGSGRAAFSGTVNPEGSPTTAYFEYGLDSRFRVAGRGIVYDQSTQPVQVGSDFSSHQVSAAVSGLVPNAVHHVRLVASNAAGVTRGPDQTFVTPMEPSPPPPVLGKSFDVRPVSGLVFIRPPAGKSLTGAEDAHATLGKGNGFIPLTEARQLPSGSQIDARAGSLELTAAAPTKRGKVQNGTFGGSIFGLAQDRRGLNKGLTTLALEEGLFPGAPTYASCTATKLAEDAGPSAHASKLSARVLQTLNARAHGRFRTRGRYSAATVRGTVWSISDRCNGTLTTVKRGTVLVQDFVRHFTVVVHAGHRYLAKALTPKRR